MRPFCAGAGRVLLALVMLGVPLAAQDDADALRDRIEDWDARHARLLELMTDFMRRQEAHDAHPCAAAANSRPDDCAAHRAEAAALDDETGILRDRHTAIIAEWRRLEAERRSRCSEERTSD